jgi:AAA+ ATPase superfamily predicted ATPase
MAPKLSKKECLCKKSDNLISAIKNNQDITLFGYRRFGKSALIHHIFQKLHKEYVCIYTDIWGTSSIEEFTKELVNGIISSKVFSKQRFSDKLLNLWTMIQGVLQSKGYLRNYI